MPPELMQYSIGRLFFAINLQNSFLSMPVAFMSADINSEQKTKASGLGVVNFIQKPFDSTTIFGKVKTLLQAKTAF